MMNTLIPVISFTLGLISWGAVIIRRGLLFIVLGGGFHSRVGAHRSETKHTNKSRLAHWRGLITNLIHRHLMKDSLRSWRYCVGARLKFWRRSRVPKKGSGDEAAPPSNLSSTILQRLRHQISLHYYTIPPAMQAKWKIILASWHLVSAGINLAISPVYFSQREQTCSILCNCIQILAFILVKIQAH